MNALELLNAHNLRRTSSRTGIIEIFLANNSALSELDIENQMDDSCDRATIYRTLKTFLEAGIIHKVLDENNLVKYALCKDDCTENGHNHEHVHFKCSHCGETVCLEKIPIQPIELPSGYHAEEANLLIIGTCEKCNP